MSRVRRGLFLSAAIPFDPLATRPCRRLPGWVNSTEQRRVNSAERYRRGRVLRPPRSRPGQVRDVAPRSGRECVGDARRRRVRLLAADLLSGSGGLRQGRHCGTGAEEAGASWASQAQRRGARVSRGSACSRSANPRSRIGKARSTRVSSRHTSQDNRTSARRKKKPPLKDVSAVRTVAASFDSTLLTSGYEALRMAALGEPVAPEARSGLGLLLRRGIWGWARALIIDTPRQPSRPSSVGSALGSQQALTVVQVLAAMALGFNKEAGQ